MLQKNDYIEYLLSTPFNYTCTNLADHKPNLSHDSVSDFLRRERFTPSQLWASVAPHIEDSETSVIIADDSVQNKKYSNFIELVKKQYSGNEHGTVKGIGLVNFVHSSGNEGDFWPIDYRVYSPEDDGKTKNDGTGRPALPGNVQAPGDSQAAQSQDHTFRHMVRLGGQP